MNHISLHGLHHKTPLESVTGQQPDISAFLAFHWFQPVYFKNPKVPYPSNSQERSVCIVGIAEQQGDALTFLVLDDITSQVLTRSELRPFDPLKPNLRTSYPVSSLNTESSNIPEPHHVLHRHRRS